MPQSAEDLGSQRWNVARGIATDVISAVLSVVDLESGSVSRSDVDSEAFTAAVEQVRSENDYWPFEDVDEVFHAVEQKAGFSDGPDGVNELGRYVSARLVGEADRVESQGEEKKSDSNTGEIEVDDTSENGHSELSANGHVEGKDGSEDDDSAESGDTEQDIVPPEELGPQRWNVARGIASDTVTAIIGVVDAEDGSVSRADVDKQELNETVETLRSEQDYWPFDDVDEVFDAVAQKAEFSDGPDGVNELGRYVSARLVDETDRVTPAESYEQLDIEDGSSEEVDSEVLVENRETETGTETETDSTIKTSIQDTDSSVDRVSVGDGSVTFQIAADLYYCFLEQDKKYTEIKDEYDAKFPPRSVLLTDVVNTSGTTEERIRQLEQYVAEWYQDDDAVEKLSKFKRKPMGA